MYPLTRAVVCAAYARLRSELRWAKAEEEIPPPGLLQTFMSVEDEGTGRELPGYSRPKNDLGRLQRNHGTSLQPASHCLL